MIRWLLFCILLISIYCEKADENHRIGRDASKVEDRRKRGSPIAITTGAVIQGIQAVRKLLFGAQRLPSYDLQYFKFRKQGGWQRAMHDFSDVTKTTNPKLSERPDTFESLSAEVGDRFLLLKSHGDTGNPELDIMKFRDDKYIGRHFDEDRIRRIIYTD